MRFAGVSDIPRIALPLSAGLGTSEECLPLGEGGCPSGQTGEGR